MSEAKQPKRNWPKYNEAVVQGGRELALLGELEGLAAGASGKVLTDEPCGEGTRDFERLRPWVRQAQRRARVAVGAPGHAPF